MGIFSIALMPGMTPGLSSVDSDAAKTVDEL
jgi:hypothetical protein